MFKNIYFKNFTIFIFAILNHIFYICEEIRIERQTDISQYNYIIVHLQASMELRFTIHMQVCLCVVQPAPYIHVVYIYYIYYSTFINCRHLRWKTYHMDGINDWGICFCIQLYSNEVWFLWTDSRLKRLFCVFICLG